MWLKDELDIHSPSNFYSHIPCGMWHEYGISATPRIIISTHTSRVGCDYDPKDLDTKRNQFLLTHPVWDVTIYASDVVQQAVISTHTSRVGCDEYVERYNKLIENFYSHIPCGMWLSCCYGTRFRLKFLLTHPVWDVTSSTGRYGDISPISTHTSRVGCDTINTQ